jgi:hypothetical protein
MKTEEGTGAGAGAGRATDGGDPREGMMVVVGVANTDQGGIEAHAGRITAVNPDTGQCDVEVLNLLGSGSHTIRASYSPVLKLGCWTPPAEVS